MSAWQAAPLAVSIILGGFVALFLLVFALGWLLETLDDKLRGRRFKLLSDVFTAIALFVLLCLVWYGVFSWLMGWA